jgi:hypothetical protein
MNDPQAEYRKLREARRAKCEAWEHADYLLDKAHEARDLAREAATVATKKHLDANRAVDELKRILEDALVEYSAARRACEQFREALEKQREQ